MKALILAAGYATRMYPLTLDKAKPLLPVAGRAAIEHIIERLGEIKELEEILAVTNEKFFTQFKAWQNRFNSPKPLKILNDESKSEDERLGAIGDMHFAISAENIREDLLVIAGDNLFEAGLREFVDFARDKSPGSSIGLHNLADKKAVKRYSQVRLDSDKRISEFIEKPQNPTGTLVAKCIYFFPEQKLSLISRYLESGGIRDAPGHYIGWLSRNDLVYGFIFSGRWYDIGNKEIYKQADRDFDSLLKDR